MAPTSAPPSRRDRLRAAALAEIREHGYAQIAAGGPAELSLNGIAKAMGMSGPAMYRYFASRDELLATLVTESYEELADALVHAAATTRRRGPDGRLRAATAAYRNWALAQPHRYRLMFGSTYGSGALAPERVIPASQRSMGVLLAGIAAIGPPEDAPAVPDATLRRDLVAWGTASGTPHAAGILALGVVAWTRLHGIVSLEVEGVFAQMAIDPARLYRAEVDRLVAERSGAAGAGGAAGGRAAT
ncbi:putative HTH-type transcriptional regulator [Paraconexibacter sp. AEG42_29]|uniref:HTH-type transcriptional regulator n=1 Tax=Paraconexibacter sp. AEG42_29 TaxID=2997339 RepID=A0AAU7ATZ4_9ACTN